MSDIDNLIENFKSKFGKNYIKDWEIQPNQVSIEISPNILVNAVHYIFEDKKGRLVTINASRIQFSKIELIYIFSLEKIAKKAFLLLRTWIPAENGSIESVTPFLPAANFLEREISEMVGIQFINHPEPYRIFLPYDWPEIS